MKNESFKVFSILLFCLFCMIQLFHIDYKNIIEMKKKNLDSQRYRPKRNWVQKEDKNTASFQPSQDLGQKLPINTEGTLPNIESKKKLETTSKQAKKIDKIKETTFVAKGEIHQQDQKKIKKHLLQIYKNASEINLQYDIARPNITLAFNYEGSLKNLKLIQLIKFNPSLACNKSLILKLYDTFYRKIDRLYFDIAKYACHLSQNFRVNRLNHLLKQKRELLTKQFNVYFTYEDGFMYFLLFDNELSSVQFNASHIEALREWYPDAYLSYKQLKKVQSKNNIMDKKLGEEVDSDEQTRNQKVSSKKQLSSEQIKNKINSCLQTNFNQYKRLLENKNNELKRLNFDKQQLATKIRQEIIEGKQNLQNYFRVKEQIQKDITKQFSNLQHKKEWLKKCLKRLILAQKQLSCKLPIISHKNLIFQQLNQKSLIILEGQTGSGKSTQLPQLLCQYFQIFEKQDALPVLITQPRKLATRTLASRVASELDEDLHEFVDYQTSLVNKINEKAKIVFKLDRLVLDELKVDPLLSKYSCLVIDEAHERTISIDLILGFVKNLLEVRKEFKVIVTSASMDFKLFEEYFSTSVLRVSGRMFPVKEIFVPYQNQQDTTSKIKKVINGHLLDPTSGNLKEEYRGHVLAFCSDVAQIDTLVSQFRNTLNPFIFAVLPLHGKLTTEQQREVFVDTHKNKIIFCNRIAETSVTINNVRVVIDPGEDMVKVYDQRTKIASEVLKKISKSSAKQRAGRAGRTREGFCFRIYALQQMYGQALNNTPEINNMELDTVVLRLKSLNICDVINFPFIQPPDHYGLLNSLEAMKMIGCLDSKTEIITSIGLFVLKLPIQPFLARAIIEAMIFDSVLAQNPNIIQKSFSQQEKKRIKSTNITVEVIKILCLILNSSNLFNYQNSQKHAVQKFKFQQFRDEDGDFFYLLKIYNRYLQCQKGIQNKWAADRYLSIKSLKQTRDLQREIRSIIKYFGSQIQLLSEQEKVKIQVKTKTLKNIKQVILSCLITSFVTNLAVYSNVEQVGYTILSNLMPIRIYETSILPLQQINPKWIICYDFFQQRNGGIFCKIANSIDFQFILDNANQYSIKKYKVQEAALKDPLYESFAQVLPSLVFKTIQKDYQQRHQDKKTDLHFLKNYALAFQQETNRIDFFFQRSNQQQFNCFFKKQEEQIQKKMLDVLGNSFKIEDANSSILKIQTYISKVKRRFESVKKYKYLAGILVKLGDGLKIEDINFNYNDYQYEICGSEKVIQEIVLYCKNFGEYEIFAGKVIFKLTEDSDILTFKETVKRLIINLGQFYEENDIRLKQIINNDKTKKVPIAKLLMHFWDNINTPSNQIYVTYQENQIYRRYIEEQSRRNKQNFLAQMTRSLKKSLSYQNQYMNAYPYENGVCCSFYSAIDEIEFRELLQKYQKQNPTDYSFQMPTSIFKQRIPSDQYDLEFCFKTKIEKMLNPLLQNKNTDTKSVRVWSSPSYIQYSWKKRGCIQIKTDYHAEIKGVDLDILQKFQQQYDKRKGVIGSEKVHIKFEFEQIAAIINTKVFNALREDYAEILQKIKLKNSKIIVKETPITTLKQERTYIYLRCENKSDLIEPCAIINKLFSAKSILFDDRQFGLLCKTGKQILDSIQFKFKYRIYFTLDENLSCIKVYCDQSDFKQIQFQIRQEIKKIAISQQQFNYIGKNLSVLINIIENSIKQFNGERRHLNYQINFKERKIKLIGDKLSCVSVKNKISQYRSIQDKKSKCQICHSYMQNPYKLFSCPHEMCWYCLSSYIRKQIRINGRQSINCLCCDKPICIFDIQCVMNEDEFIKLCNIKILEQVHHKSDNYIGCTTPNCQNFFEKAKVIENKLIFCQLCGQHIRIAAIKKCRTCNVAVEKKKDSRYTYCVRCNLHTCWECLQAFSTGNQCFDHLQTQHGGIFYSVHLGLKTTFNQSYNLVYTHINQE